MQQENLKEDALAVPRVATIYRSGIYALALMYHPIHFSFLFSMKNTSPQTPSNSHRFALFVLSETAVGLVGLLYCSFQGTGGGGGSGDPLPNEHSNR